MKKTENSKYYLAGIVSLITFVVYFPSLHNEFVEWDDSVYIFENPHIHSFNMAFVRWAFLHFYASNWHPLTWISHAIDYAVWGLNPMGHHLTNNILHAINTFLVLLVVARLIEAASKFSGFVIPATPYSIRGRRESFRNTLKDSGQVPTYRDPEQIGAGMTHSSRLTNHDSRFILIAAVTTGLLFGLHPLHVESVAWVSERKDLLCAFFFLLSIMMYVEYAGSITPPSPSYLKRGWQSRGRYLLALFFFILALLSKPMAVSLPLVLLILDWYPFKRILSLRTFRNALVEKLPFVALSLMSSVVTILAQKSAIAPMNVIPLSKRALVAGKSLIAYLWKMIVPLNLIPFYPYPKEISILSLQYLSAVVLVIGITTLCIVMAKKQRLWPAAWSYYVATLIPVLGFIQVGSQEMADRYAYLPALGPFMLISLGLAWIWTRSSLFGKPVPIFKPISGAAAICVTAFIIYLTIAQIGIWKNSFALWSYVIEKESGGVPVAYHYRGVAYGKTGRFDEAITDFTRAIELKPSYYEAYNDRALIFEKMGRLDRAIADFTKAIELKPSYYEAYNNRALIYGKMGRLDRAIADFAKATDLNPSYYKAYNNQGVLYGKAGFYDKAIAFENRAIAINPYFADAYFNRGLTYFFTGQYDRALENFHETIELDQDYADAYFYRANIYLRIGNKEPAAADFRRACDLGNKDGCKALKTRTVITDQGK